MSDSLLHWEDYPVGERVKFAERHVTREEVLDFARLYDPQPFHLDDDAAKASLLGGLAASGWHVCAMTMRAMCDGFLLRSAALGAPGVEEMRWMKPVFVGDTITLFRTTLDRRPSKSRPKIGLTQLQIEIFNQSGTQTTQARFWQMFARRAPGA